MNCEICGKEGYMYKALVEGTELTVCEKCAKLDKGAKPIPRAILKKEIQKQDTITTKPELLQGITPDYGPRIRKARMKLDMTQEEFAKKLNIKESILQKIENSAFEPPIDMAEKLQKILHIKLIEEIETEKVTITKEKTETMTIGDMMMKKKA